ncbi:unnamed protein product [Peniophora sp. CBMAI 1063]|nr:unnamed protein product [Peniophora sp. CBMAI 1063]
MSSTPQTPFTHLSAFWTHHRTLAIIFTILSAVGFGTLSAGAALVLRILVRIWLRRSKKPHTNLRPLRLPTLLQERTSSTTARAHVGALVVHSIFIPAVIARFAAAPLAPAPEPGRNCTESRVPRASLHSRSSSTSSDASDDIEPIKSRGFLVGGPRRGET